MAAKRYDSWPYYSAVWQIYLKSQGRAVAVLHPKYREVMHWVLCILLTWERGKQVAIGAWSLKRPWGRCCRLCEVAATLAGRTSLLMLPVCWRSLVCSCISGVLVPLLALHLPFPGCFLSFPHCCQGSALFLHAGQHLALIGMCVSHFSSQQCFLPFAWAGTGADTSLQVLLCQSSWEEATYPVEEGSDNFWFSVAAGT